MGCSTPLPCKESIGETLKAWVPRSCYLAANSTEAPLIVLNHLMLEMVAKF